MIQITKPQIMCLQLLYTRQSSLTVTWSNVRKGNLSWAWKASQSWGLHSHYPQGKAYRLPKYPTKAMHTSSERDTSLPTSHHSTGTKTGPSPKINTKMPHPCRVLPCPPGLNRRPYETCQGRGPWQRPAGWSQSRLPFHDGWLGETCPPHLM